MTRRPQRAAVVLALCLAAPAFPQSVAQNPAITTDPAPDAAHPATMESFQLPSHGAQLNALIYIAAGAGPHPTAVLLHGFPGNEKNLDLAQVLRRAGWNVLYFDYRGSWGSPGDFSFTHCIEDAQAAVAWLRDPANDAKDRVDPQTLALVGHSMGGFIALVVGAQDPALKAIIGISAADFGAGSIVHLPPASRPAAAASLAQHLVEEGMAPLAGTTPQALADEVLKNAGPWSFPGLAPRLTTRPVLLITSNDGLRATDETLVTAIQQAGGRQAGTVHFDTDHAYSDHRIALESAVLDGLASLSPRE
jgi:pimeloyl-ACP methyl ester carboxylesterase